MFADELYPDQESLTTALSGVLDDHSGAPLNIWSRQRNPAASTFPAEVVHCARGSRQWCVLCKYGIDTGKANFDHRGDVGYEAKIYRQVLSFCPLTVPMYYGAHHEPVGHKDWLFIEYLTSAEPVHLNPEPPRAMMKGARWLGEFHRWSDSHTMRRHASLLKVYDATYYEVWAQRAARSAGGRSHWIERLCERSSATLVNLLVSEAVVIHGEFYDQNVMIRDGVIYPVDWQSAALSAGEIDLASFTDCWDDEISRACELEYQRARWSGSAPRGFAERLKAARVYWLLRWLAEFPECFEGEKGAPLRMKLRADGEQLGLV